MVLKTVKFDSKNPYWVNDREMNITFIRLQEVYLNDLLRHRGYMYLNQICEMLGAGWNVEDENPYIRYDNTTLIRLGYCSKPNMSLLVHISYD